MEERDREIRRGREREVIICLLELSPMNIDYKTQDTHKLTRIHRYTPTTHLVSAPVLKGSSQETQDDRQGLQWYSLRRLLGL
jgi:hypothetical protein